MTELFDDDDLFAPRPRAVPPRRTRKAAPVEAMPLALNGKSAPEICVTGPRSYSCERCSARDEVKSPAPDRLDCWDCHSLGTMRAIEPRFVPPIGAGRELTGTERRVMSQ